MTPRTSVGWAVGAVALGAALAAGAVAPAVARGQARIPAAHIYHNHMPNFWPYFGNGDADVAARIAALSTGDPIRYTADGDVIALKASPPAGYPYYLPASAGGGPMPHDDLVQYYSANAKYQCYQGNPPNLSGRGWPMQTAELMQTFSGGLGQVHVTFSGALATNVNSIELRRAIPSYYPQGAAWNGGWLTDYQGLHTQGGFRTLDLIHFAAHHSLGPLVGREYLEKDLIAHGATLAQPWFLGDAYRSSNGFFPTELSFSERIVPVLARLGIAWSVLGNNHFSRTLTDYPYADYDGSGAAADCADTPPNRADLRNVSTAGGWVGQMMAHNNTVQIVNKFPFGSTPHRVRYVDPLTGQASQVVGIPVSQNGSWLEGWDGSATVDEYVPYADAGAGARQLFVLAHDGDNSSGRSGALDTWENGVTVTGAGNGYDLGIDEYLKAFPVPPDDVQHVQDGSWGDVLDASTNPMFYHWHWPPGFWTSQVAAIQAAYPGAGLHQKDSLTGPVQNAHTVSLEYGWNFQELAYAKLQVPLNYAVTAEQIWLDGHPSHWAPTTALDQQVTHAGNQLSPWMIAAPVKGDPAADWAGGANPAELAWYFLLPAMDSGFGYYGENVDDTVKPVLAFNNALAVARPYVTANAALDRTGPSVWVPQRYPYSPGSKNSSRAEGYATYWFNQRFAVYTYVADAAGVATVNLMIRPHVSRTLTAHDDTYKLYHPEALQGVAGLDVTPGNVGAWTAYPMQVRDLHPVMNGVAWVAADQPVMQVVPADDVGNLYYAYLDQYRDQIVDYYVQATDALGNLTSSDIQQVYVGPGTYVAGGASGYTGSASGTIQGTDPFVAAGAVATATTALPDFLPASGSYAGAQQVQILCGTAGAEIHYTTDGSAPTVSSPRYGGPVTVAATGVLRAIALAPGLPASGASAARYVIGKLAPQLAAPTFDPPGGAYASAQQVTLAAAAGAAIHYTTDGSAPTAASPVYAAPIAIAASTTVQAIATGAGYTQSPIASATYVVGAPAAPAGVGAVATSSTSAVVSWSAAAGATSYAVERASASAGPFAAAGTAAASPFTDGGLAPATSYWYRVVASNAAGASAPSAAVQVTTPGGSGGGGGGGGSGAPAMYLRGTMNAWGTTPMTLTPPSAWAVTATLNGGTTYEFKFDASGTWASGSNWGDDDGDGVANANGANMRYTTGAAGAYVFRFDAAALTWSVAPAASDPGTGGGTNDNGNGTGGGANGNTNTGGDAGGGTAGASSPRAASGCGTGADGVTVPALLALAAALAATRRRAPR